jgi:uncharacterized membrane protein
MTVGRMEAFSDGVLAIIITIMVLELRVPIGSNLESLIPLIPLFISYVLSFINLGIYWNNHHHLLHAAEHVSGSVLWANLHLLFWLSLIPFATAWMGENHFAQFPVAFYGIVLLSAAIAYYILVRTLISANGKDSIIAVSIGKDFKGKISPLFYALAIPLSYVHPLISGSLYILVAVIWLIPDRRIERNIQ